MFFLRLIAFVLSTNFLSTISSILVECVEITRLDVDTPIIAGEGGWLNCDWDEKGDSIYTMKWYWGTQEFYRWTPKSENPILVFPLNAFKVDQTKSSKGHVFIKDVKLVAEGKFLRCEVSGEGPFFQTDYKEDKLTVVDLPDTRPRITGSLPLYRLHSNVVLTCTSPRSKPAASLAFYINGEKADSTWLIHHSPQIDPKSGLETAMLGIKFTLLPRLLHKGEVMVKCAATVKDLYWESNEQIIRGDVPLTASRMEERASSSSGGGIAPSGGNVREGLGLGSSFVISFLVLNIQRFL